MSEFMAGTSLVYKLLTIMWKSKSSLFVNAQACAPDVSECEKDRCYSSYRIYLYHLYLLLLGFLTQSDDILSSSIPSCSIGCSHSVFLHHTPIIGIISHHHWDYWHN